MLKELPHRSAAIGNQADAAEAQRSDWRRGPRLAWGLLALLAVATFLADSAVCADAGGDRVVAPLAPSSFVIVKAEGRDADEVYVTYNKPNCYLSGVNSAVAFHYKSRAQITAVLFWTKWASGETKTFKNTEFRQGPIQQVDFWGTARENSMQDGKKVSARVTFSERKSF